MRTMRVMLCVMVMAIVGSLTAVSLRAHHAFAAEFDANRPVKLQGSVVRVEWVNPHTWFHVDVKNDAGQVERWMFEGGGPGALTRRGFKKDFLKPGTELVIEGFMSKGVPRRANARSLKYSDGRTLFVGSSGTGAPEDGLDPDDKQQ